MVGLIAQERKPQLSKTIMGDPRIHDQEWVKREGMAAFAGYPLVIGDQLVGVMAIFSRHPLSETAMQEMPAVANEIALGIEQKHAAQAVRRRTGELEAMLSIANALAGPESFEAKAGKILVEMKTLVQGDQAGLRLPAEDGQLTIETAPGAGTRVIAEWPLGSRAERRCHERNHRSCGRS